MHVESFVVCIWGWYESHSPFQSSLVALVPSTYVYTSFVSDLVLANSVVAGKTSRSNSIVQSLAVLAAYCVGMLPSLQNHV